MAPRARGVVAQRFATGAGAALLKCCTGVTLGSPRDCLDGHQASLHHARRKTRIGGLWRERIARGIRGSAA